MGDHLTEIVQAHGTSTSSWFRRVHAAICPAGACQGLTMARHDDSAGKFTTKRWLYRGMFVL